MVKTEYVMIAVAIVIIGAVVLNPFGNNGAKEEFAACLTEKGAKFYGAFWCPHCNDQKALFGSAAKSLPYIECSTPDGSGQLQACRDAQIGGYPTWRFDDGSEVMRVLSLEELAGRTGCTLT